VKCRLIECACCHALRKKRWVKSCEYGFVCWPCVRLDCGRFSETCRVFQWSDGYGPETVEFYVGFLFARQQTTPTTANHFWGGEKWDPAEYSSARGFWEGRGFRAAPRRKGRLGYRYAGAGPQWVKTMNFRVALPWQEWDNGGPYADLDAWPGERRRRAPLLCFWDLYVERGLRPPLELAVLWSPLAGDLEMGQEALWLMDAFVREGKAPMFGSWLGSSEKFYEG